MPGDYWQKFANYRVLGSQTIMIKNNFRILRHNISAFLLNTTSPPVVRSVVKDSLTYLGRAALNNLYRQVKRLENSSVAGIFVEGGCALGGSSIVIATAKSRSRPFLCTMFLVRSPHPL